MGGGRQTQSQFAQFLHFRNSFTMTNHNGVNTCKQWERESRRESGVRELEGAWGKTGEWGSAGHLASGPTEDNRRPAYKLLSLLWINKPLYVQNALHLCTMDSVKSAGYGWVGFGNWKRSLTSLHCVRQALSPSNNNLRGKAQGRETGLYRFVAPWVLG